MIVELLLNILKTLLFTVFGWINLPNFTQDMLDSLYGFIDMIFDNLTLLVFFIRPITLKLIIPTLIILLNFDEIYKFTMWILKKIPALNIH